MEPMGRCEALSKRQAADPEATIGSMVSYGWIRVRSYYGRYFSPSYWVLLSSHASCFLSDIITYISKPGSYECDLNPGTTSKMLFLFCVGLQLKADAASSVWLMWR